MINAKACADDIGAVGETCPLCEGREYEVCEPYGEIGNAPLRCSLLACKRCGHYFTGFVSCHASSDLYEEDHYELIDTRTSVFGRLVVLDGCIVIRDLKRIQRVLRHLSILDFGCGKGVLLSLAARHGWRTRGIETARRRAEFARTVYHLDVDTDEYRRGRIDGAPFDVIVLSHVLEHLPRPKGLLKNLVDANLSSRGLLMVEVPRFDSLQSKLAGPRWIHLDPPRHLSHFTLSALTRLLTDLRFQIIERRQLSIHNGLFGMVQAIMSRLGYRKMLVQELKFNRTMTLMLTVFAVLPFAVVLEALAIALGRGGVIRLYCRRANEVAGGQTA